ncbi:MAG TPA: Uma2 family endonuclease [Longimicrobiaceae bacterium]|nr:Uma2 family endonuclease [Longimicrobiaceae bacterium]
MPAARLARGVPAARAHGGVQERVRRRRDPRDDRGDPGARADRRKPGPGAGRPAPRASLRDVRHRHPGEGSRTRDYVYPDVTVVCGGPQLEDEHFDTLLNPTLIVEVLAPSTAGYDRGEKWEMYRRIPSLKDYLLVSQTEPRVERYTRQGEGLWLFSETNGLDSILQIDSIGCTLALRDVYERVL